MTALWLNVVAPNLSDFRVSCPDCNVGLRSVGLGLGFQPTSVLIWAVYKVSSTITY